VVAYLLGHGSPAVTMQVYTHFIPGAGEGVADVLVRWYASGAAVADRKLP
jgi:hypothetical protein